MATQRRALLALCFTLAGVLAAGVEDEFGIQPEIVHQFRPQEKMPSKIVSQFASLLVLAPWIALLAGWAQLGYTPAKVISNIQKESMTSTLSILSFLGTLVAIEFLFFSYWTHLNLFQTLGYLSILSLAAFFTGQRALTVVQQKRIRHTDPKKTQ
ncbi:Oligosaccharyltransferase subunit Ribophorin II-domain-containing protein [Umbelopsis sp. PMI_123]|nr:Oligosaccharyltransferase subunit Ribophorin II-domain-containing protein [Umbelopsis sp. PMI_123]